MKSLTAVTRLFSDVTAPVIEDWVARGWVHVAGASPPPLDSRSAAF